MCFVFVSLNPIDLDDSDFLKYYRGAICEFSEGSPPRTEGPIGCMTDIHWRKNILSRADFCSISDNIFEICPFQNGNDHVKKKLTTSCVHVSVMLSLPGYFRPFSREFPPRKINTC